ncbi:MAG: hypothetical protein WB626_02725, partial [Bacteroidota bacterium]
MKSLIGSIRVPGLALVFVLYLIAPASVLAQRPITYGQCVRDSITQTDPIHRYFFPGNAGEVITVRMVASWVSGRLEIYDQGGTLLWWGSGWYSTRLDTLRLAGTGTYWIWVMDQNGWNHGRYDLFLQRTASPVGARSIAFGQTLLDTIQTPGSMRSFVFPGFAGKVITIRMVSSWQYPQFEIYDPGGMLLQRVSGYYSARLDTFRLHADGIHAILTMDANGWALGDFNLTLLDFPIVWYGAADSSWENPANWFPRVVPTVLDSAVITPVSRSPVVSVPHPEVAVGSLFIMPGGMLTVAGSVPRFRVQDVAQLSGPVVLDPEDTLVISSP